MTPRTFFLAAVLLSVTSLQAAKLSKYELGQKQYREGDLEAALKSLDQAADDEKDEATLSRVHLLRGQCLAARQDFTHAEDAFSRALSFNPLAELDPSRVDPMVVKLLDAVRSRLVGTVVVSSRPPGAAVGLDGALVGPAPREVPVSVGRHTVTARFGESEPAAVEVLVRPRQAVVVHFVEVASAKPAVEPPSTTKPRPFADIRATLEVAPSQAPLSGGLELGGGAQLGSFRFGLWARLFPFFGLSPRAAFVVPVTDKIFVGLEAQVPVWFRSGGVGLGVGGAVDVEYRLQEWFGCFGMLGGQHMLLNPNRIDDTHFLATAGVRLHVP